MSDMTNHPTVAKRATVHRMVMPSHTCPYGLKAIHLLKRSGYRVDDHHLTTREETDAFKAKHAVATTPHRNRDRVGYDRSTVHAILDEAWFCHLACAERNAV